MHLETPWGQASYASRSSPSTIGWLSPLKFSNSSLKSPLTKSARRVRRWLRDPGQRDDWRSCRPRGVTDLATMVAEPWSDWALIDCGHGQKLERYGDFKVVRPEPQAMWAPARDDWDPDATFVPGSDEEGGGRWVSTGRSRSIGNCRAGASNFHASLTPFRHLGFFPDMAPQWDWMRERAADADVLNLFGYTGVGTLLLSDAGASMVHVDASKKSVEQGKDNAELSGLDDRPIRWMVDDAGKFTAREVRRGRRYDGICSIRPSSAAAPKARCGGWRRISRRCSPIAASCSMRTAASSC